MPYNIIRLNRDIGDIRDIKDIRDTRNTKDTRERSPSKKTPIDSYRKLKARTIKN